MKTVDIKCKICGSWHFIKYGSILLSCNVMPETSEKFRGLFKCLECRCIFIDPVPTSEELVAYYNRYAQALIGAKDWHKRKSLPIILKLANIIKSGRVLDIGCGHGNLLDMLPDTFKKYGERLPREAIFNSRLKGIKVYCSPLELVKFETKFDLVIALDFIEHVNNPLMAIKKMCETIKPGGYLVIETGNAESLAAKIYRKNWSYTRVFGHLAVLSPMALNSITEDA